MLRKEFRRYPLLRRLVRDRLGAVLAELKNLSLLVRTRPRAALAIKPGHMIDLQERFRSANRTHIANAVEHSVPDRRNPRRVFRSTPDPQLAKSEWILRLPRGSVVRIQLSRGTRAIADRRLLPQL